MQILRLESDSHCMQFLVMILFALFPLIMAVVFYREYFDMWEIATDSRITNYNVCI